MTEKKTAEVDGPRLVRATAMVFYNSMRIRPGKTFTLLKPSEFNPAVMAYVEDAAKDDTAAAVEASPKTRGPGGSQLKQPYPAPPTAAVTAKLDPEPGI